MPLGTAAAAAGAAPPSSARRLGDLGTQSRPAPSLKYGRPSSVVEEAGEGAVAVSSPAAPRLVGSTVWPESRNQASLMRSWRLRCCRGRGRSAIGCWTARWSAGPPIEALHRGPPDSGGQGRRRGQRARRVGHCRRPGQSISDLGCRRLLTQRGAGTGAEAFCDLTTWRIGFPSSVITLLFSGLRRWSARPGPALCGWPRRSTAGAPPRRTPSQKPPPQPRARRAAQCSAWPAVALTQATYRLHRWPPAPGRSGGPQPHSSPVTGPPPCPNPVR